ncbi:uncharacterized protein GGS22DRAFT_80226 [Annulohypoxylon maeteangense]|uniref:uncharacterized protein n=1 Tax=Annulohypoxylon maeteangense TaxID=1927788 RepID=UPI0020086459|nr:uncharacterized protein GGS22DRAFT_80226 [Annulohypoxylon maeteangense]KAI0880790.1 hypothetical protein GGS22DRAFT_80226 [Annulohypoxylon maeteangense]
MSAKKEPSGRQDLDEMERSYWETTKYNRAQEDKVRNHEYADHQDGLRNNLVRLYDTRTQLQHELLILTDKIQQHEKKQEQLAHDFEESELRLREKRQKDDRAQEEWFLRAREDAVSKENARPKSSSSSRRQSNREAPSQTNGAGWTSINGARRRGRREEEEEPPADPGNLLSSIYHNPVDESESINGRVMPLRNGGNRVRPGPTSNGVSNEMETSGAEGYPTGRTKDRPLKPKQRHSLPSFPAAGRSPTGKPPGSESSIETKTKSPSGRKSLPSAKGSLPPTERSTPAATDAREITRERLAIKDDGKVVTEPPMFAGTPLERINMTHPYWDPEWESLDGIIQPQLDKWKEKLEQLKQTPDAIRHTIFLANRQVNRGQAVVDFLRNEQWHPYQFVGKEMMNKFYKTFINYDTMFRLVNVHEELKKFDLDMTPLEWLRQRMCDIAEAQGDKFNLSKTTHDLYHDANLKLLREKHGFGNIGRPSGYKLNERNPERAAARKIKQESGSVRRKGRRSIGQVDPDDAPSMEDIQKAGLDQPQGEYLEPVTPRMQKRQRIELAPTPAPVPVPVPAPSPPKQEPEEDDLDYSGWTSTDSFSAGRIMHLDWRVYQIKTRALTTSTEVTQYWTWKQDKGLFEHQVLRDVHPKVTWGFYQKPINFDLTLEEIKEIRYGPDSQKILVDINDEKRGNVLAYFKRERTKKRFLAFAKKKGIKLVKSTRFQLEELWDTMESKTLPDEDSDT